MNKNEQKELARVEKRLREVIEARLERGDALVRMDYGFSYWFTDGLLQVEDNGCRACVLGSVVVEELLAGRRVRFRGTDDTPSAVAANLLQIEGAKARALESGFMDWRGAVAEQMHPLWGALGRRLSVDYYETTDSVGE